jgi:hypothetical protein
MFSRGSFYVICECHCKHTLDHSLLFLSVMCAVCGLLLRGRGGPEEEVGGRQEPSQHAQGEQHPLHTAFTPALFTPLHLMHPMHLIKSLRILCSCNICKPFIPCTLALSKTLRRLTVCTYSLHSNETLHPLQPYQPLDTNLLYPLYSTSLSLDTVHPCTSEPPAPLCTTCKPTAIFFRVAI